MEAIHISERYNRNSILKNGLRPSKVVLEHHLDSFREFNYLSEEEDKMLYMWLDSEKNQKFIKDMMYCKMWLDPRNKESIKRLKNNEEIIDWSKEDMNLFYPYRNMIFDIYKIQNPKKVHKKLNLTHIQQPSDYNHCTTFQMDAEYAHDDKYLVLSKTFEYQLQLIGQAQAWIDNSGKIQTKVYKTIRY